MKIKMKIKKESIYYYYFNLFIIQINEISKLLLYIIIILEVSSVTIIILIQLQISSSLKEIIKRFYRLNICHNIRILNILLTML